MAFPLLLCEERKRGGGRGGEKERGREGRREEVKERDREGEERKRALRGLLTTLILSNQGPTLMNSTLITSLLQIQSCGDKTCIYEFWGTYTLSIPFAQFYIVKFKIVLFVVVV